MTRHRRAGRRRQQQGLGLLEVMLLTFVLSGALVAGYLALQTRSTSGAAQSQALVLAEADRALAGFAAAHNRLPCPDTNRDGVEDCTGAVQKGWLPYRTLGLEGAGLKAGVGELRYLVQRQAVDLATATDVWQPVMFKNNTDKYTGTRSYAPLNIGTPDLCSKLSTGGGAVLAAGHAQVAATAPRPVAYALAHPGSRDEDGDGNLFDAVNATGVDSLNGAEHNNQTSLYDDRVSERSYGSLALALDCDRLLASLNGLSLATEVVEEVADQAVSNTLTASVLTAVSLVKTGVAVYKTIKAAIQLATSIGYMATASSALSAAIAGCAVIVGCAAIPYATASVAAAAISIAASGVAVAASGVAAGLTLTAAGLTLSAAIMAGVSTIPTMDISEAVTQSKNAWDAATLRKNDAYAMWQEAVADEASSLQAKTAAVDSAYSTARYIVKEANAAGDPDGTKSIYDLDGYVTTVLERAQESMVAENNYAGAVNAYDNAVKLRDRTKTNIDKLNTDLVTLPAERQALLDQIAATPAPTNPDEAKKLADLVQKSDLLKVQIDLIPQQITDLTNKLTNLNFDVASRLANKNTTEALRVTAYTAYATAYNNVLAQSRLPYVVTTCPATQNPGEPACTTGNHTYDGQTLMQAALTDLFGPLGSPGGEYFHWYAYQQKTLMAKDGYDQAVNAEIEAKNAYDGLKNRTSGVPCTKPVSEGSPGFEPVTVTVPGAPPVPAVDPTNCQSQKAVWNGAAWILHKADQKGGIR